MVRVRVRIRVRDRVRVGVRLFSPLRRLRCAICFAPNTESRLCKFCDTISAWSWVKNVGGARKLQ